MASARWDKKGESTWRKSSISLFAWQQLRKKMWKARILCGKNFISNWKERRKEFICVFNYLSCTRFSLPFTHSFGRFYPIFVHSLTDTFWIKFSKIMGMVGIVCGVDDDAFLVLVLISSENLSIELNVAIFVCYFGYNINFYEFVDIQEDIQPR